MAVDLTLTYHISLYLLFLESLLFFAVIMQTKSMEPGSHSGIARYFGIIFLFQSISSLFLVLSEQFYDGYLSLYLAILAVIGIIIAVFFCIPAAVAVAFPEFNSHRFQASAFIITSIIILLTTFSLPKHLNAAPDIPYITALLRGELLGAITGAYLCLTISSTIRLFRRQRKGRNGALILLTALVLILLFGLLWLKLEPLCIVNSAQDPWPDTCPVPKTFDHNTIIAVFIILANILAAEGVLRLMAAGTGVEGYSEIIPTIET